MNENIRNVINAIKENKVDSLRENIENLMKEKTDEALETRKVEIAKSYFAKK